MTDGGSAGGAEMDGASDDHFERDEPWIGVVVLNWNGTADTVRCLTSLRAADQGPRCVVVVDNASRSAELSGLRAWITASASRDGWCWAECADDDTLLSSDVAAAPWLVLQTLSEQRGFSGGNNAGVRMLLAIAQPTHVLLLNNDTVVTATYFTELREALNGAPRKVILSGTINEMEPGDQVWYAGGRMLPRRALVLHDHEVPYDPAPRPTGFVTGCAMVISRAALDMLGPLPECYFPAYMEDAEYCWRAHNAGVAVLYAPRPLVHHRGGASAGRATASPWPAYLNVRHRVFFARRNLSGAQRAGALIYLSLAKPARALLELARGRPAMASAQLRGLVSGLCSPAARQQPPGH